jgi:hypothetical protein
MNIFPCQRIFFPEYWETASPPPANFLVITVAVDTYPLIPLHPPPPTPLVTAQHAFNKVESRGTKCASNSKVYRWLLYIFIICCNYSPVIFQKCCNARSGRMWIRIRTSKMATRVRIRSQLYNHIVLIPFKRMLCNILVRCSIFRFQVPNYESYMEHLSQFLRHDQKKSCL